jgi:hypothetical protein
MTGANGSHPDLREAICAAVNQSMMSDDLPEEHRMRTPATPDQLDIRCQRTWHTVTTINPRLNGGDFSACVTEFTDGGDHYAFFIEAAKPIDADDWQLAGWSGGKRPPELDGHAGGFMIAGGSHVCVGGIGYAPDGGKLRVEMADGSSYEDVAADGCAIVFAPVMTAPAPDDHVVVSWHDASGATLGSDRVFVGDGRTPPPRRA